MQLVKRVVLQSVLHEQKDQDAARDADREPGDIDERVSFMVEKIAGAILG